MLQHWHTAGYKSPGCWGFLSVTAADDSAMYGNMTKLITQWAFHFQHPSIIKWSKIGFKMGLKTALSILSGCNRPPRVASADDTQIYTGVGNCESEILYWGIQKRRLSVETEPDLCSLDLWSTAKQTGPRIQMQTLYPTTALQLQMDTSCYFFHSSPTLLFRLVLQ